MAPAMSGDIKHKCWLLPHRVLDLLSRIRVFILLFFPPLVKFSSLVSLSVTHSPNRCSLSHRYCPLPRIRGTIEIAKNISQLCPWVSTPCTESVPIVTCPSGLGGCAFVSHVDDLDRIQASKRRTCWLIFKRQRQM